MKVDGTGRYSYTGLFNKRPALGLAVFESSFYWVDDKGLWQLPQNQPNQKKFIWKAALPILSVYHELQQPQGTYSNSRFTGIATYLLITIFLLLRFFFMKYHFTMKCTLSFEEYLQSLKKKRFAAENKCICIFWSTSSFFFFPHLNVSSCCHQSGSSACVTASCHLCLLTKGNPVGFTCACPNSKVLLPDGTCECRFTVTFCLCYKCLIFLFW